MAISTNLDIAAVSYNGQNIPLAGGGSPTLQTKNKTYTPSTSQQTESVTADSGYDGLSAVNVTVNAIPSGTEGTPTATKGTVSNHSVSVTPSVTNSAGYISGGTRTGTAVSVSASELDSGTKSISSNGSNQDVVGYAAVDVNVPNSYSSSDEGKVVSSGALVSQSSQNISSNGTYDTTLKNEVVVFVPNSYSQSDEGKVVSNGTLVAQGSDTVTQNGTVDTTLINSLLVNVPTGGSVTAATGTVTLTSDLSLTTSAQPIPGLQLSFQPDVFYILETRSSFESKSSITGGLFGFLTLRKSIFAPLGSNSSNVYDDASGDFATFPMYTLVSNVETENGYMVGGLSAIGKSYQPRFVLNSNGTVSVGRYSSATTKMYTGTYRYIAVKI